MQLFRWKSFNTDNNFNTSKEVHTKSPQDVPEAKEARWLIINHEKKSRRRAVIVERVPIKDDRRHLPLLFHSPWHGSSYLHTRLLHHHPLRWKTSIIPIQSFWTVADLECDYLNAQECCGRLNFWNIPKLWLQLLVTVFCWNVYTVQKQIRMYFVPGANHHSSHWTLAATSPQRSSKDCHLFQQIIVD